CWLVIFYHLFVHCYVYRCIVYINREGKGIVKTFLATAEKPRCTTGFACCFSAYDQQWDDGVCIAAKSSRDGFNISGNRDAIEFIWYHSACCVFDAAQPYL